MCRGGQVKHNEMERGRKAAIKQRKGETDLLGDKRRRTKGKNLGGRGEEGVHLGNTE